MHVIIFYFRTGGHYQFKITIKDKEEKLIFVFNPKDKKKKTSIQIHHTDCLYESTSKQHVTGSIYTPLSVFIKVDNNQTNCNTD